MNKQNSSAKSTHNKIDVSPLILIGGFFTPILPASFVQFLTLISADNRDLVLLGLDWKKGAMSNPRWGYFRIISGTIGGGVLGFYFMHRAELKYKEMWNERLRKYEEELNRRKLIEEPNSSNEFSESV